MEVRGTTTVSAKSAQDGCKMQNPKGKSQVVVGAWSEDRDLLRVSDGQADKSRCQEQRASLCGSGGQESACQRRLPGGNRVWEVHMAQK